MTFNDSAVLLPHLPQLVHVGELCPLRTSERKKSVAVWDLVNGHWTRIQIFFDYKLLIFNPLLLYQDGSTRWLFTSSSKHPFLNKDSWPPENLFSEKNVIGFIATWIEFCEINRQEIVERSKKRAFFNCFAHEKHVGWSRYSGRDISEEVTYERVPAMAAIQKILPFSGWIALF